MCLCFTLLWLFNTLPSAYHKWEQNKTPWLIRDQYNSCHAFFIFTASTNAVCMCVIEQKSSRRNLVLFPALSLFLCDFGEPISLFTASLGKNLWSLSAQQKENIKTQTIISRHGKYSHTISQLHWSTTSCCISLAGPWGCAAPFDFSWFIANSYLCSSPCSSSGAQLSWELEGNPMLPSPFCKNQNLLTLVVASSAHQRDENREENKNLCLVFNNLFLLFMS